MISSLRKIKESMTLKRNINYTKLLVSFKIIIVSFILGSINTWIFIESLSSLVFGKDFTGRSLLYKVLFFSFFFILISYLLFIFISYISKSTILKHPVTFLLTINFWAIIFYFIPRGFDLTDNGYYLLMAHHFEDVYFELTLFGLVTRLLFTFVGESTQLFRILGAMIVFISSFATGWATKRVLRKYDLKTNLFPIVAPTITAALFYRQWISTPNYNWLALIACLWFYFGLMQFLSSSSRKGFYISGIVVGTSSLMAFWAKPTTATMLFFITIFFIVFEKIRKTTLLDFCIGIVIGGLFGLSLPYWSGETITHCVQLLTQGNKIITPFGFSFQNLLLPTWSYFLRIFNNDFWVWAIWAGILILFALIYKDISKVRPKYLHHYISMIWIFSLVTSFIIFGPGVWAGISYILTVIFIAVAIYLYKNEIGKQSAVTKIFLFRSLYGIFIAFSIAFGTTNPYTYVFSNNLCIFTFSLSFLLMCLPERFMQVAQHGGVIILLGLVSFQIFAIDSVYRQDVPIWDMRTTTSIRNGEEEIILSDIAAKSLSTFQEAAYENGFSKGTPVIDMTGSNPGIVYILDGRSYATPWFIGGLPYSETYNRIILSQWSEVYKQNAWVLTSNHFRKLPLSLLSDEKIEFPDNYIKVSSIKNPYSDRYSIDLWKPNFNN